MQSVSCEIELSCELELNHKWLLTWSLSNRNVSYVFMVLDVFHVDFLNGYLMSFEELQPT